MKEKTIAIYCFIDDFFTLSVEKIIFIAKFLVLKYSPLLYWQLVTSMATYISFYLYARVPRRQDD